MTKKENSLEIDKSHFSASNSTALKVAVGVLAKQDKILLTYRDIAKPQGGFWEFPGGKINPGESARHAIKRELFEELSIIVNGLTELQSVTYSYNEKLDVSLRVFVITHYQGNPIGAEKQRISWFENSVIKNLNMTPPNFLILKMAQEHFLKILGKT